MADERRRPGKARGVVTRRATPPKLPQGMHAGPKMPNEGPTIYIGNQPEPGFIFLRRSYLLDRPTEHPRARVLTDKGWSNPFAGKWGWTIYAMGKKAWAEKGLPGAPDAEVLRAWVKRIPNGCRVALLPRYGAGVRAGGGSSPYLPKGDPLSSGDTRFRNWISDDCVKLLIDSASRETPGSRALRFAVPAHQEVYLDDGRRQTVHPIRELMLLYRNREKSTEPALKVPAGMSLADAGKVLQWGGPSQHLVSIGADSLFTLWRDRVVAVPTSLQPLVNVAYHRILLHRFLQMRPLTPTLQGNARVRNELERRAQLIQAYRIFVFNRLGCPVAINARVAESNNLKIQPLVNKKVPHTQFAISSEKKVQKFGRWLFETVLNKTIVECSPKSWELMGPDLHGLLAAAEAMR